MEYLILIAVVALVALKPLLRRRPSHRGGPVVISNETPVLDCYGMGMTRRATPGRSEIIGKEISPCPHQF